MSPLAGRGAELATVIGLFGLVAVLGVCRWRAVPDGADLTDAADYTADEDDPGVQRLPELVDGSARYRARHAR